MPNVVVQTVVRAQTNVAAAAKNGLQRAAIHSNRGKTAAMAISSAQGSFGKWITSVLRAVRIARAEVPSINSFLGIGSVRDGSPIKTGATAMMPIASDVNQCHHTESVDPIELWNKTMPTVPTIPDMAVTMTATTNKPITRCRTSNLNGEIKNRAIRPATSAASPALSAAKTTAVQTLRSPNRFAAIVPAIVPTITGIRAPEPILISAPAAIPAAGQKTATPSGFVRRARLSRAAKK